jgi:hypothetical protein
MVGVIMKAPFLLVGTYERGANHSNPITCLLTGDEKHDDKTQNRDVERILLPRHENFGWRQSVIDLFCSHVRQLHDSQRLNSIFLALVAAIKHQHRRRLTALQESSRDVIIQIIYA